MKTTRVNIDPKMLTWAIARAGYLLDEFISTNPDVAQWLNGEKLPTVKQLEKFSKRVHVPFGYLFLENPIEENIPIPFFRTNGVDKSEKVSLNVYDTILILQQRQDWLKDYLKDKEFDPLPFVGKYRSSQDYMEIANNIRVTLGLESEWASKFSTWQESLRALTAKIEDNGIITTFNGVVENNNTRPISVDECRGFVLVDEMAPFIFVNNNDFKSAQIFTLAHELAHIWTGHSAGFDFRRLRPANDPIEILCDKVAAEFLVPEQSFRRVWAESPDIERTARYFKVSQIVIARRALDLGKITKSRFFDFYEQYSNREIGSKTNKSGGGDFYLTAKYRVSLTFAGYVNQAVKGGSLLYRDAYRLTSMGGDTFQKFLTQHSL